MFPKQVNTKLRLHYNNPAPMLVLFIIPNERKKNENEGKGKRLTVGSSGPKGHRVTGQEGDGATTATHMHKTCNGRVFAVGDPTHHAGR